MMDCSKRGKNFSIKPYKMTLICSSPPPSETLSEVQSGPLPRSGHRMVCVGHKLYIFGGYNPNIRDEYCDPYWQLTKPLFAELWVYNTISEQWYQQFQCHMGRSHGLVSFGCAVTGDSMLHFGGTGVPFGESSNNWLYLCDLLTGAWEKLETTGQLPLPAYGQGAVLVGPDLYLVGGTTGFEYNLDVHYLNLRDRVWKLLHRSPTPEGNAPLPRYRHELVVWQNELLMIGGGQKDVTAPLDVISAFSVTSHEWRSQQTQVDQQHGWPQPRKCHITVRHSHYTYIHGGCDDRISFGDMWRLDLSRWQWQRLVHGDTVPRHFHAAAVTQDGCLYLHGGVGSNGERSGELLQCWLTIPSLHRMCWQAMMKYFPNLLKQTPLSLYHLGLPTLDIRNAELNPDPSTIPPRPVFPPLPDETA